MASLIGTLWFDFYIKKVRAPFFGLTPLQQYIVDNNNKKENDPNPFLTYLYFLTYEKEVLDRKYLQEENKEDAADVYEASRKAVMTEQDLENTTHKMLVHMLSLVFIVTLMLSASAVSTGKLMALWGESFGPYAYLAQGFFFGTAAIAQWFIYRKSVPEVLKKFLSGKEGWHFNKHRELEIVNGKLVNKSEGTPDYNKGLFAFFLFTSFLLAVSLGMIVLDTSSSSVDDGNVFKSMTAINGFAQIFGGVSNFGWLLCIASIACNFALFVNASLKYLFEREKKTAIVEEASEKKSPWSKAGAAVVLAVLVLLNYFGLTSTVMSQSQSTLNFFYKRFTGDDKAPEDSDLSLIFMPAFTIVAGLFGRGIFNFKAMQNIQTLLGEMWTYRSEIVKEFKQDIIDYKWSYLIGTACIVGMGLAFGLGNGVIPFVASLGASIVAFAAFKMRANYIDYHQNKVDSNHSATLENIDNATKHTFTLKRDSERRSGQELFIILSNSVGAGALAMSSVSAFLAYSPKDPEELKTLKLTLTIFALIGGGLMSMGSALNRVNADTKPKNKLSS